MSSNSLKSSNAGTSNIETMKSERWYWLDWLRVLAMGMMFLYHSARPFDYEWSHIRNTELDLGMTFFAGFVRGWIMPLFFVIAGMATFFSLGKRTSGHFAKERFMRLIIPLVGIGWFVILPVHVYFEALFWSDTESYLPDFTGSCFIDFYFWWSFVKGFEGAGGCFPLTCLYLWYLFWLFIFSFITVHFFKYLREKEDTISKLAAICNKPGGIFLLAVPLIIVEIITMPPFFDNPGGYGGWKLPMHLLFFVLAYVLASDSQFAQSIDKHGIPALVVGIITSIIVQWYIWVYSSGFTSYILFSVAWAFNGWCWVIAILSLGRKFLSFNHKWLKFLNELVLPFYVLHQTVIVVMAFYVVGLNLIVIVKFLIIVLASFAIISLLLAPIRQINVLRFLFGMRLKKRKSA